MRIKRTVRGAVFNDDNISIAPITVGRAAKPGKGDRSGCRRVNHRSFRCGQIDALVQLAVPVPVPAGNRAGRDRNRISYVPVVLRIRNRVVPKEGFYFNENDCWAYISGTIARVGVTDFVQQSLSDIMFFTPPSVGSEVEQFGELGTIESGKAVFEVVSPVSGKIIAVNGELDAAPELINKNPYEKGWIADIELTDFESDKELLLEFDGYYKILKRKVDDFHVRKD